jgi:uncharacterized membrane protein YfbV (UPF0208 family)
MVTLRVPSRRNPFAAVRGVKLAVGTEGSDAITVTGTVYGAPGRVDLNCWLSSDSAGAVPVGGHNLPSGGYAAGASGTIKQGPLAADRLIAPATLAIDAVPEKFKLITLTALYHAGGSQYTKAPATAIVFTAAHVVSAAKFGVVLVQVNAAGTVSTKVPLATQAYTSAALALAALPAPDAGNVALGYIAIAAGVAAWTANTDDLTNGSDVTTATFVSNPANGQYAPTFTVTATAAGAFTVVITETRVRTFYLNVRLPDGTIVTSSAITFA